MSSSRVPAAPAGLKARGRRFWRRTLSRFELEPFELELLVEVCRAMDLCEALQELLDRDGLEVAGSMGQTRAHPALGELRAARALLARLLRQLALPEEQETAEPAGAPHRRAQARKAAETRWAAAARLREIREGLHGS